MAIDPKQVALEAHALKSAGRLNDVLALRRQAVAAAPASASAHHNLGVALADLGQWSEAQQHFERALALGAQAPETHMMRGRCQQSRAMFDEAEQSFVQALGIRPHLYDAQRDLAQLRWMRTGDLDFSLSGLESALRDAPADARLLVLKAQILEYTGELYASYSQLVALTHERPNDAYIATAASQISALYGDGHAALAFAERATALAPADLVTQIAHVTALLGIGRADDANRLIGQLRLAAPNDQHVIALQATAWRLLGDTRYRSLYDYDSLVKALWIGAPKGWATRDAYLDDVATALHAAHSYRAHPFGQSVRYGTQVPDVMHADHPALKALPEALDGAVSQYIALLGSGADAVRSRNTGAYRHQGMWSIRMNAGGFHIDHVHPAGWISSACYIETPDVSRGREGWIRFGHPGIRTKPNLDAEYYIQPERGKIAFFPSYMWHGTEPYTDRAVRMTIAYDITPG